MRVNPERLAELQRQRNLVRDHLAWLDREIAASTGSGSATSSPHGAANGPTAASAEFRGTTPTASPTPATESSDGLSLKTVGSSFQPDPGAAALQARRGCLMAMAIAVVVVCATFAAIYWLRYRDRPLFFAGDKTESVEKLSPPSRPAMPRK